MVSSSKAAIKADWRSNEGNLASIGEVVELNGNNYRKWRNDVEFYMGMHQNIGYCLLNPKPVGTLEDNNGTADDSWHYCEWYRTNRMAKNVLRRTMSEVVRGSVEEPEDAVDYMAAIAEKFEESEKAEGARLHKEFHELKDDGTGSVREHIMHKVQLNGKLRDFRMGVSDAQHVHEALYSLPSSSSAAAADVHPGDQYDVFLSFRGRDTREKFTSYLYEALKRKKIDTYMDDRLETGDEIGPALVEAIERSRISIIIFSKDYASSKWCLDELVHILKCKERYGRIAIPVFYEIDPYEVRHQVKSYGDAFVAHEKLFKNDMDKVLLWKHTLSAAADLSGFHSSNKHRSEPALVDAIVEDVSQKLNRNSSTRSRGLFGIESQIQQLLLFIQQQRVPIRMHSIGIWGTSGIGKTTIAREVFLRLYSGFDSCSFLEKVRDQSDKHGMNHVREKLFRDLLKDKTLNIDSQPISSHHLDKLSRTKALVVLDDATDSSQLEALLGNQVVFDWGSRIIITSRDKSLLLDRMKEEHVYTMNGLETDAALELFHVKASRYGLSKTKCLDLSRRAVEIARGIPLFLTVLSSSFGECETREEWEDELNRWCSWQNFQNRKIEDCLRPSYDRLADDEKGIFLDIACFFKGEKRGDAERKLRLHGFSARIKIKTLINKSLISISKDDHLEMHDFLQEMGWSIVREECIDNPGLRSRLWKVDDVDKVLRNEMGSTKLQAICSDISKIPELDLNPNAFKNMHSLWFLRFYAQSNVDIKLHLPYGLEFLPGDLKYLYWKGYPLECLPSKFSPRNLVELHLPNGKVKKLWNGNGQDMPNLKTLNLEGCERLNEVDFSLCPNIGTLVLSGCTGLKQLYVIKLAELTTLKLSGCSSLKYFPEMPRNLQDLDLSRSELTELPDLSQCLNLEKLYLHRCKNLVGLPKGYLKHLTKLTTLNMAKCSRLETSPEIPRSLRTLDLSSCTKLCEVSDFFSQCPNIEEIDLCGCTNLERLPILKELHKLTSLELAKCSRLIACPELPRSIRHLDLSSCPRLTQVPKNLSGCLNLETLDLCRCTSLAQIPELKDHDKLNNLELVGCLKLRVCPKLPRNIQYLNLSECSQLTEVPDLSGCSNLETLDLCDCTSLVKIPDSYVRNLDKLTTLYLKNCSEFEVFPKIPRNVRSLDARYCSQVTRFPDISGCHNIEKIDLSHCTSLVHVEESVRNLDLFQYPYMKIRLHGCTRFNPSILSNFTLV